MTPNYAGCTRNFHKRCVYLLRECTPKSPEDQESGSDNNFSSSESLVQVGVPQGSILGLLYILSRLRYVPSFLDHFERRTCINYAGVGVEPFPVCIVL